MPGFDLRSLTLMIAAALALLVATTAWGQEPKLSVDDHAWARFNEGAWKKVRVVTETLDAQGQVTSTSTTDTSTLLENVSNESYQLQVDVTVEVAGRQFDAQPQHVTRGLFGESEGERSIFKPSSATHVMIEGERVPCEVHEIEIADDTMKRVSKVYYAAQYDPPVLRKETVTTDLSSGAVVYETVESVVAVKMPQKVLNEIVSTWHLKTVRKNTKGSTITLAVYSDRVPGGVVSHTSKELDPEGRVIRRSTLELIDYGLENDRRILIPRRPFKHNTSRRPR